MWEEIWLGEGVSMGRYPLGTLEIGQGCGRRYRCCLPSQVRAVRMECSEPRAWRYLLSHLSDFFLVTGLQGLLSS